MITWAMRKTTRLAGMAGIPVTGTGPRPCSPRPGRWRFPCPATVIPLSSRELPERQRRLSGIDEMVISLSAKGLTHDEIAAHLAEVYGAEVSKQTITTITDRVM